MKTPASTSVDRPVRIKEDIDDDVEVETRGVKVMRDPGAQRNHSSTNRCSQCQSLAIQGMVSSKRDGHGQR